MASRLALSLMAASWVVVLVPGSSRGEGGLPRSAYAEWIRSARRLEMLTQKYTKDMLFLRLPAEAAGWRRVHTMHDTGGELVDTLTLLVEGNKDDGLPPAPSMAIFSCLRQLMEQWGAFAQLSSRDDSPWKVTLEELEERSDRLASLAGELVNLYEKEAAKAGQAPAEYPAAAALDRQRMLGQRVVMQMAFLLLGHDPERHQKEALEDLAALASNAARLGERDLALGSREATESVEALSSQLGDSARGLLARSELRRGGSASTLAALQSLDGTAERLLESCDGLSYELGLSGLLEGKRPRYRHLY